MKFSECLKQAREKAGITQKELAEKLNVPAPMISRYETSDTEPRIGFVVEIAKALGITLNELIPASTDKIDKYKSALWGMYYIHEEKDFYEITDICYKTFDGNYFTARFNDKTAFENKLDNIIAKAQEEGKKSFEIFLRLNMIQFMNEEYNKKAEKDFIASIRHKTTHNEE